MNQDKVSTSNQLLPSNSKSPRHTLTGNTSISRDMYELEKLTFSHLSTHFPWNS